MNWYKKAQNWYTKEVAQTTKDPQILTKILRIGNDDWVSCYAANNPNCPPEILKEVLGRGENNNVSCWIASNPNCPPEALAEVLERGKIDNVSEKAAKNPNCPPEALKKVLTDALNKERDNWISQHAAGNPNCPTEILKEILMRGKDDGLSAYAALNPNCPPEILAEVLKKGENSRASQCAALNQNCPPEALMGILSRDKNNDNISYNAIKNPNCPPDALVEVLRRGVVDRVSCDAARDKRCPKETLIEVLRRKKDDQVSFYAANNPNCPDEEKIKWMQATGKIEKEDESKGHIIEYEKTNQEDDLSDLKKLLGKTFNLKKNAQHEDGFYYEEIEIIKHTKDPKILIDILRREKDDVISRYAAKNPNCPPEMLIEILRREKNDGVSWRAASNPNCPKEMLTEVLRRGKDNLVSVYAAINPNCPLEMLIEILRREKNEEVSRWAASNPSLPPEILIEILKKGKDDYISQGSVENPNCPDEAKIKWMQATGKIEKEDESKGHIIEYEKTNQEDDLSDLKKLISKNIKLNKYSQEIDYPNIDRIKELAKKIDLAYNITTTELAKTTKDPKVLIDILRKGNDDNPSFYAALNPNCPSEMLTEILKREKDNFVSWNAANNPNCPPEALKEVLERDKNDWVSRYAASNPNCPVEMLVEILRRKKDDNVSRNAAHNPNCPDEAKIRWMQETGQIEKEDESKGHIIEYEKTNPEEDLSDLKKLLSKNIKLNKYAQEEVDYPNIDRIKELAKKIDMAYKNKQFENIEEMEQELEMLIERTSDIQEEKLVEGGGEVEGYDIEGDGMDQVESPSLEELLANGYLEYINFDENKYKSFGSKQDIINNMRSNVIYYGGFSVKPNVTDEMILDAAKDAYERRVKLINKHKKYKKARSLNMSWYKRAQSDIINIDPNSRDFMVDMSISGGFLPSNIRLKINKAIHNLGNYHEKIPMDKILDICKQNNAIIVQEDGTPWSGFLMGGAECGSEKAKEQYAHIDIAYKKDDKYVISNNYLVISWCKMPSGKYEIVSYIS